MPFNNPKVGCLFQPPKQHKTVWSQYSRISSTVKPFEQNGLIIITISLMFGLPGQRSRDNSIIDELNLLQNAETYESRVVKIESFIYAQESPESPHLRDSYFHDDLGNIIPAICNHISPYPATNREAQRHRNSIKKPEKAQKGHLERANNDAKASKRSIREEIMQENRLLEQRLSLNQFGPKFEQSHNILLKPRLTPRKQQLADEGCKKALTQLENGAHAKLQQQYNKSKVIRLYNFILKELPACKNCHGFCGYLIKQQNGVSLKCKSCRVSDNLNTYYPFIGLIYDLENKHRFDEEAAIYQDSLEKLNLQIDRLKAQIESIEMIKKRLMILKGLNRKRYKEINESKFFLKKHLPNIQNSHLRQLEKLIPKQYLQQMELWQELIHHHSTYMCTALKQIYKIMPVYLQDQTGSKLISSLHKILNYEKDNEVKISVSQHIKFPIKTMESATFVVDGTYNLPVFENIKNLHLQFENKKTMRQLNVLFGNFPREIYELSFAYNHKTHSHISAENFPFLRSVAAISSLKKLHLRIENVKEFDDILEMTKIITPKIELNITITKHPFCKQQLYLPQNYYQKLLQRLGKEIVKFQLDLPEVDSQTQINYEQLLSFPFLSVFRIERGWPNVEGRNLLDCLDGKIETEHRKALSFKKAFSRKAKLLRLVKNMRENAPESNISVIKSIFSFLI